MLKSFPMTIAAVTLLSACDGKPLTFHSMPLAATRAYAESFQDTPFERGEISVVAEEHGELHTFSLRPCGSGHICGARQGDVVKAPDYHAVTGAYPDRTFFVSPGGDGWIKRNGTLYPMAWN